MEKENKNKNSRFNRAQIQWMKVYDAYEYKIVDFMMFKSWSTEQQGKIFKFHVNHIAKETALSKGKVSQLLNGWNFMQKFGVGQKSYFTFDYSKCCQYYTKQFNQINPVNKKDEPEEIPLIHPANRLAHDANVNVPAVNSLVPAVNGTVHPVNTTVHIGNETVHIGNETVHGTVPISSKEVNKEVVKEVAQKKLKKHSDDYKNLLFEFEFARTFNKMQDMQSLLEDNEQVFRENKDYDLFVLQLNQCKKNLLEQEKRKNSSYNKFLT